MQHRAIHQQFERIMREHGAGIVRLASAYASNPSDRDDLVQDIALGLWRVLPMFRNECSERTLVFRIAHNRAITHVSRRPRSNESLDRAVEAPDPARSPERLASDEQLRERLRAAVRQMSASYRHVIILLLEGMTYGEIADILGISEGNVAVRATRARKELRSLLGGRHD